MRLHPLILLLLSVLVLLTSACDDELTPEQQREVDREIIEEYVAVNNFDGTFLESGVFYALTDSGSSSLTPRPTDEVEVIYEGSLLDGTVFDDSGGFPATFELNRLIRGWQEGMQYFPVGSEGILIIPSGLAYGPRGSGGSIPPNTVIRFDIELLGIN
jgi:FKBP-type peptidyl-prolyl cis-trans isomerase